MPCLPSPPEPTVPALGGGLSLTPPEPTIPEPSGYCCTLPPIPTPDVPGFLGIAIAEPGAVGTLRGLLKTARAALDSVALKCPRE